MRNNTTDGKTREPISFVLFRRGFDLARMSFAKNAETGASEGEINAVPIGSDEPLHARWGFAYVHCTNEKVHFELS